MLPLFVSGRSFAVKVLPVIERGSALARFFSKRTTDAFISRKISKEVERARETIKKWFSNYRSNVFITIILNAIILSIALISYYFFTVNKMVICVIAFISIFMLGRSVTGFIKSVIRTIIPYWSYIRVFFMNIFDGRGIAGSIRDTVHWGFCNVYYDNTNGFSRGAHAVFSKLRFVKSYTEISEEVQEEVYCLITSYTFQLITYTIIAFSAYCVIFALVLRPFVFSYTMNMNVFEVLFYPFTVALPAIINIIRGGV